MMLSRVEISINKLWDDFQLYIKGNWTLPIEFGIKDGKVRKKILAEDFGEFMPLNQVQPQIKFCQVLCEILKHNLSQKGKNGFKVPHENTMRNFLKAGLSSTTQKNTLNTFAAFLGYEHFDDYRRRNSTAVIKEYFEVANNNPIEDIRKEINEPATKNITIKSNTKTKAFFYYSILLFIGIAIIGSIFRLKNNSKDFIEKNNLISVIQEANKAEFEAYSKIPVLDTLSLDSFFVNTHPGGSARASIIGALTRRTKAGCVLVTPMSSYNLIKVSVEKIQDTLAYLNTTEKWHLRWFDTLQKKEVLIYDTTNNHSYILVKKNETWKVLIDDYEGKLRKPSFAVGGL